TLEDSVRRDAGGARLMVGRARVASRITLDALPFTFAVLHFGDHNVNGGVRRFDSQARYEALAEEVFEAFSRVDFAEVIRVLDRHFQPATYSLKSLFRDQQRIILDRVLEGPLREAEAVFTRLYEAHSPLMRFL